VVSLVCGHLVYGCITAGSKKLQIDLTYTDVLVGIHMPKRLNYFKMLFSFMVSELTDSLGDVQLFAQVWFHFCIQPGKTAT